MTAREELTVHRRWLQYRVDKPVSNKILAAFYRDEIQADPKLQHCNAFEILDTITNAAERRRASF